jgi:uncharacterized protein YuzE
METLKLEEPNTVSWDYDEEADVLYISFGDPEPALTLDLGEGILARYRESDHALVGFTIVGAGVRLRRKSPSQ